MRRAVTFSILLIILLVLVACGGGKTKTEPTAAPAAATQAPAPAAGTRPTATKAAAAAPTATTGAAEEALPTLKPGALKSYVAKIEIKSEVVKPETAVEAWSEVEMTYRLDPAPVAYVMVIKDKTQQDRPEIQMTVIGKDMYFKSPDEAQWIKLPTDSGGLGETMQTMLDPEALTKGAPVDIFTSANVVNRNETVDGVATTHYRATEAQLRALMEQQEKEMGVDSGRKLLSGTADFWIAKKGNYLKQYRADMLQEDESARQIKTTMQMLITRENQPVTIEPPPADQVMDMSQLGQEAPEPEPTAAVTPAKISAELAALPAPPRSKEYQPGELSGGARFIVELMAAQAPVRAFLSDASPKEVDDFYEAEMPKLGYKSPMQQPGELGIAINLYMKGAQNVMIRINQDSESGKTLVTLQMP